MFKQKSIQKSIFEIKRERERTKKTHCHGTENIYHDWSGKTTEKHSHNNLITEDHFHPSDG